MANQDSPAGAVPGAVPTPTPAGPEGAGDAQPAGVSLDDLMRKQGELLQSIEQFGQLAAQKNIGADALARMSREAQSQAEALQALAGRFAAQQGAGPSSLRGKTQVQLTPLQQYLVKAETGEDLQVLVVEDSSGAFAGAMPLADPVTIGRMALLQARQQQARRVAEQQAQAKLQAALDVIETQGSAELKEQLKQLRRDPNFLGGALQKKGT